MATWEEVEPEIKKGNSIRRMVWPSCKHIRGWQEDDHDYFTMPIPNTEGIIMQVCDKPCDCKIGIWIKEKQDIEAGDWYVIKSQDDDQS